MTEPLRLRRSARVFLFDEHDDVLLIRFVAEQEGKPFIFWVTPGGEVESGEDDLVAAKREVFEELGIAPTLVGPVLTESGGEYVHLGERVRNHDVFFAACCPGSEPRLQGVTAEEIALMREARWWTLTALRATDEKLFPRELASKAEAALKQLQATQK